MRNARAVRAVAVLAALVSLALLVAACGGDDNGDEEATATEPAVVEPTATEPAAGEPTATEPAAEEPTATEPSAPAETSVDVTMTEWQVAPSVASAPAGTVTFDISNEGAIFHNFRVIRSDLAPDALPVDDATFTVDEAQVDVRANTDDFNPGESVSVTADLEAGSYVLICNVPTHYDIGMTVGFTIE